MNELYKFFMILVNTIFEILLLWLGIQLAFVGGLALVFVSNWTAIIPLLMLIIGILFIKRGFKVIKKFIISSQSK